MKKYFLILLFYISCGYLQAQTFIPKFKKGERVAFVGNSITHGGHYHSFIWLYYMTRFPDKPITIMNAGIGGESAWDIKERMNDDVFDRNPTYIALTFGMNDTGYDIYLKDNAKELSEARIARSLESYREIEERLLAKDKITKVLIGGSPYDETSKFNNFVLPKKNDAILRIIDAQQRAAKKNGWGFVDFNHPMCEISLEEQKKDSTFTFCRIDRIHPDNDGQMVMAYLFLKAQGLAGKRISEISIDAHNSEVIKHENCKINGLKRREGELSFNYLAHSLPYPLDSIPRQGWGNKRSQRDAIQLIPFVEEFNQECLQITNLDKGNYQLTIDGIVIDEFSSEQLADGINLADYPHTPQYQQAAKIMYLNEERFELEKRFREYLWTEYSFLRKEGLLFADNQKAVDKLREYLPKDGFLRMSFDWYIKAMHPEIREVWSRNIEDIVKTIYRINKPVTREVKLMKVPFILTELKCENLVNPLGIDNATPHFSWKLKGDRLKGGQAYYEIQVASDSLLLVRDKADLWNTGKLKSDASVMVPYQGSPLTSRSLCYWRVRAWDQKKQASAWSPVARFSVGILDKSRMQGEYIGLSVQGGKVCAPILRKKVNTLKGETYFLHVNTLGYHEIYINGKKVGENVLAPAVSHLTKRSLIVTYDITPYLSEGENDLLIWLGQGWYKKTTFGAAYDGPLVKAELDVLKNGKWEVLAQTDSSWLGRESGYEDTGSWRALQFAGEKVDGRVLPADLSSQTLDKMKWVPVVIVDVPNHIASPQMCEANKVHHSLQPVSINKLDDGGWLVDMGKVQTGWFEMQMPVLPIGHEVMMEYSDNLTKEGEFDKQGESDIYISGGRKGECFRNKFNHHAYRYVRITNLPVKPEAGWMKSLLIHGNYKQTATFECSDADLNAIHDMIQYTMKCLTFSGYMVDCPHLERAGYGGDGNSSTMSLQTMYDVAPTFENWVQTWSDSMREGGSLPHVGPNPGAGGGGPYWCGFFVLAPWRTYINYNDPRLMEHYYNQMKEWFKYVDTYTVDGLLKRWPDTKYRDWYLGDWLAPAGVDAGAQSSVDLVSNCFISECLGVMNKMALTLGNNAEAEKFADRKEKLNKLIHRTFYRADEGIYSTGSQLDMCYPMLVGVVPESEYDTVMKNMLAITEDKHKGHIAVGLVGVPILTEWAVRNKQVDFFYRMMKKRDYPSYLYMIDNGATATWEYWSGERSRVHNCYNGIGTWFYQALGGIRPDESAPGYRHVYIEPQIPTGVTWVKSTKETPYGTIAVHWELKDNQLNLHLTVPSGTTATVRIPDNAISCKMNENKMSMKERTVTVDKGNYQFMFDLN